MNFTSWLVYIIKGFTKKHDTERRYVGVVEVPAFCVGEDRKELLEEKLAGHTAAFVRQMCKDDATIEKLRPNEPDITTKSRAFELEIYETVMVAKQRPIEEV